MPKDTQGEKRSTESIGVAFMVAQMATGEIGNNKKSDCVYSGKAGTRVCIKSTTPQERSDIAKIAAKRRWKQ